MLTNRIINGMLAIDIANELWRHNAWAVGMLVACMIMWQLVGIAAVRSVNDAQN